MNDRITRIIRLVEQCEPLRDDFRGAASLSMQRRGGRKELGYAYAVAARMWMKSNNVPPPTRLELLTIFADILNETDPKHAMRTTWEAVADHYLRSMTAEN